MKKIYLLIILILSSIVFAEVSSLDKTQIQNQVILITNSVNNNDIDTILNIVSKQELKNEIDANLRGKTIQFQQSIYSYKDLGNNRVEVKTGYIAKGIGWSVNGLSNYYIFEKSGDSWLLIDTNFHKMGAGTVLKVLGIMFGTFGLIFLLPFIFWLWMLIDCVKRQFEDKVVWIIIICLLNILGAILYFFMVRRKFKRQKPKRK